MDFGRVLGLHWADGDLGYWCSLETGERGVVLEPWARDKGAFVSESSGILREDPSRNWKLESGGGQRVQVLSEIAGRTHPESGNKKVEGSSGFKFCWKLPGGPIRKQGNKKVEGSSDFKLAGLQKGGPIQKQGNKKVEGSSDVKHTWLRERGPHQKQGNKKVEGSSDFKFAGPLVGRTQPETRK